MAHFLGFVGGLILLLIGGRFLVSASVDAARRLGVAPLVVGLTLVAWGTSAPELALNLVSAFKGRGDLALGNVVGANICNLGLVLGVAALLQPLVVHERLIKIEIWLNAFILSFMAGLGLFSGYQRWEAALLLVVFVAYSGWTIYAAMRASRSVATVVTVPAPSVADAAAAGITDAPVPYAADSAAAGVAEARGGEAMSWTMIAVCFAGGLAMLGWGGALASDGASGMALAFGVPAAIVGVTIVSIGTTLPELVTCILAVRAGQTDLAIGNAIGSSLFNAGAIFGLTGLIAPPTVTESFRLPLAYMGLLALALIVISRTFDKRVSRLEGGLLAGSYGVFLLALTLGASSATP